MKTRYILAVFALSFALASCTSEVEETVSSQPVPLQIQVEIENSSRAANIEDTYFKEGESFRFAYELYGEEFRGVDSNIATYTNGEWKLEKELKFSDGALMQAYYPVNTKGFNDGSGLSLTMTFEAGINHMMTDYISVTSDNPIAKFTFRRMMARVRFEVVNPDAIPLNSIKLGGNQIFNTKDGIFGNNYDPAPIDFINPTPSSNEMQVIDVPLIPGSQGNATLTLNYEDGKSYITELNFPVLEMGHYYIVPVTISKGEEGNDDPEAFTITTSIQNWTEQEMNELEITNKDVVE